MSGRRPHHRGRGGLPGGRAGGLLTAVLGGARRRPARGGRLGRVGRLVPSLLAARAVLRRLRAHRRRHR
ncbi:hypothetical protein [Streptomyces aidingensis]|nr:hypothetical protein [Streptomyces aidingensis]